MTNDDILASLQPRAQAAAKALLEQFPFLTLTSGLRSADDQARAMAQNLSENRNWVEATYVSSQVQEAVQDWLNSHHDISDVPGLETGILGVLAGFTLNQLRMLSWHLSGEAFDIEPLTDDRAPAVMSAVRDIVTAEIAAGTSARVLDREGGLLRWHVQIEQPTPMEVA